MNTAKTYVEPDSSSEDVGGRQKSRKIVVKNTWAVNGSEESTIDSTASYTSEDNGVSSDTESEASDFSQAVLAKDIKGEEDARLADDSLDEISDRVQGSPLRQPQSDQRKRSKVFKAEFQYMVKHGTLNEVQRTKPWEVIAEECGVTASL